MMKSLVVVFGGLVLSSCVAFDVGLDNVSPASSGLTTVISQTEIAIEAPSSLKGNKFSDLSAEIISKKRLRKIATRDVSFRNTNGYRRFYVTREQGGWKPGRYNVRILDHGMLLFEVPLDLNLKLFTPLDY